MDRHEQKFSARSKVKKVIMSAGDLLKKRSSYGRQSPSQPKALSFSDRESMVAVLEDSVDQLAILGGIMPDFNDKPSAAEEVRVRYAI